MTTASTTEATQQQGDDYLLALMLSPEGIDDPAPWYKKLRDEMPVFESGSGALFLTRFDDCRAVLRDNRFGSTEKRGTAGLFGDASPEIREYREELNRRRAEGAQSLLFLNPPDHTRLRSLVSRAFTPRRIEGMRDSITQLTETCLDDLAERGGGDAIDILGWLPVNVIGELVGVPSQDWARFRALVTIAVASLEPTATLDELKASSTAFQEMLDYFATLVAERRARPADDLISALLEVEEAGDKLTEDELISTTILLFSAGMETTQNLIGNGLGALFKNPAEQARLWADPGLVSTAVDEMLRWDSPVQLDGRTALQDADTAGVAIRAGQSVITILGAANRDPAQFTEPDAFDVSRDEGPPLSFASGIHFCLGANLARAEGQEMFAGLVRRFKTVQLDGELVRRSRMTLRGYEAVPVSVVPR